MKDWTSMVKNGKTIYFDKRGNRVYEDEVRFERLKNKIMYALQGQPLENKIKWFETNYLIFENNPLMVFELGNEDFYCYSIAECERLNISTIRTDVIDYQIAHLESLLRKWDEGKAANGDTAIFHVKRQRWLKYLRSLNEEKTPISSKPILQPERSFKYNTPNQKAQIESILNRLKQNENDIEFIESDLKLTNFKKVFNNTPLNKISPIDWKRSIASLKYFIKQFPFENKYKIAATCFTHNGARLIYSQIENAKQVSKKDKSTIDKIFKLYPIVG